MLSTTLIREESCKNIQKGYYLSQDIAVFLFLFVNATFISVDFHKIINFQDILAQPPPQGAIEVDIQERIFLTKRIPRVGGDELSCTMIPTGETCGYGGSWRKEQK